MLELCFHLRNIDKHFSFIEKNLFNCCSIYLKLKNISLFKTLSHVQNITIFEENQFKASKLIWLHLNVFRWTWASFYVSIIKDFIAAFQFPLLISDFKVRFECIITLWLFQGFTSTLLTPVCNQLIVTRNELIECPLPGVSLY